MADQIHNEKLYLKKKTTENCQWHTTPAKNYKLLWKKLTIAVLDDAFFGAYLHLQFESRAKLEALGPRKVVFWMGYGDTGGMWAYPGSALFGGAEGGGGEEEEDEGTACQGGTWWHVIA